MKIKVISLICCIPLIFNLPVFSICLKGKIIYEVTNISKFVSKGERLNSLNEQARLAKEERERKEQERLRLIEEERLRKERAWKESGFTHFKEVTCKITYYYADNNSLQGGYNDKKGVPLLSHTEPVCAMPKDVPYGSYLILDETVMGSVKWKNVDTGGAIKWLNEDTLVVDIFVPQATSYQWLINNTQNKTIKGKIYYKG